MSTGKRVAILSPVAWRTPPRQYGAWETVAGNIAEGLVARGWDVTLFATGDSLTAARLHSVVERGYEEDRSIDPKVAEYLHIPEVFEHAGEFDLIHSHYDFMGLAYSRLVKTPVVTTIHGFSSPADSAGVSQIRGRIFRFDQQLRPDAGAELCRYGVQRDRPVALSLPGARRRGPDLSGPHSPGQGRPPGDRGGSPERPAAGNCGHRAGSRLFRGAGGAVDRRRQNPFHRAGRCSREE